MTAPFLPTAAQLDGILDALALIDAATEGNDLNRQAIIANCDLDALIVGLVLVASNLRHSLAANTGSTPAEVDELLRAMYLKAGAS